MNMRAAIQTILVLALNNGQLELLVRVLKAPLASELVRVTAVHRTHVTSGRDIPPIPNANDLGKRASASRFFFYTATSWHNNTIPWNDISSLLLKIDFDPPPPIKYYAPMRPCLIINPLPLPIACVATKKFTRVEGIPYAVHLYIPLLLLKNRRGGNPPGVIWCLCRFLSTELSCILSEEKNFLVHFRWTTRTTSTFPSIALVVWSRKEGNGLYVINMLTQSCHSNYKTKSHP